jgi:amino acid adenylation domain-containing protein
VTPRELAGAFAPSGVLALEDAVDAEPSSPQIDARPTDPLYVMYTSGSTGTPKGIAVSHRAVARLVIDTDYVALGPGSIVAQAANLGFDASTFEIFGALLNGATMVGIDKSTLLSTHELGVLLREQGITAMFMTTALVHHHALLDATVFGSLETLLLGGEVADVGVMRRLLRAAPPARLVNVYGPTETTTFATFHVIREVPDDATSIPIGRPIANTSVYVLDEQGWPVPLGEVGELVIGGDGVANGYVGRPELTATRFAADPFDTSTKDARMYRSGDRARVRADGTIEFIGRLDDQIKLRGYRVELGEIESVLREHPKVDAVAIVAQNGATPSDKRLVAFVGGDDDELDVELRAWLGPRLPTYMIPAVFVIMPQLPISPNGKIDRKALVPPPMDGQGLGERERVRDVAARIWAEVLEVSATGVADDADFLALGGHSLLAMQIVSRVRAQLGIETSVRSLYDAPRFVDWAATALNGVGLDEEADPRARLLREIESLSDDEVRAELGSEAETA